MNVVRKTEALRTRGRVGLVPTMGAFHEGHLSLMRAARAECDTVVVSLFVNPAQFGERDDLERYPRDEERDARLAAEAGVDILFAPTAQEMYPDGFATWVDVDEDGGEAAARPGHFRGVATVCLKLFNIVRPERAYFGQKDAQQALVIRRMVRDLDFPVRIEICPTLREPDGLAMSSRNVRLSATARAQALALKHGLDAAAAAIARGERDASKVEQRGREEMKMFRVEPEYFAVVSAEALVPLRTLSGEVLLAVAAKVGGVRLIDNQLVDVP